MFSLSFHINSPQSSHRPDYPLSLKSYSLYTSFYWLAMNEILFLVLKVRYILAQGGAPASFALGWITNRKIVCAIMFFEEILMFRTKRQEPQYQTGNNVLQFPRHTGAGCPKVIIGFVHQILADGFSPASLLPRVTPGFTGIALG